MLNAFTVDVEDYFHVSGFAGSVDRRRWDRYPSRVVGNTQRLLKLLDAHQVRGTFFILGWVAERFPQLVREIQRAGHDIGCHSYWHRLIYDLSPDEFRADLVQARDVLQDITGQRITAYRAPSFSMTEQSLWALDILLEEGFEFDSSIFPVRHDRYGIPDFDPTPRKLVRPAGELWEFPGSVWRVLTKNIPIGGGYFRLFPLACTFRCMDGINAQGRPFVFYTHPWEIDPGQPRLPGPWLSRLRHYINLRLTERRLDRLLGQYQFGTVGECLEEFAKAKEVGAMLSRPARDVPNLRRRVQAAKACERQ